MIYCTGCAAPMNEQAAACPSCGKPNIAMGGESSAQDSGWFGFRGRINRKKFWLQYAIPIFALSLIGAVFDAVTRDGGVVGGLIGLVTLVPNLAGSVKRLHDRERSGWFILIVFIPLIGAIWLFIETGCLRGTSGRNRFGTDPLAI